MKTQSVQQEILLMTGSKFSAREWAEKNVIDNKKLSGIEQLEEACWNGLLDEMLPELVQKTTKGKKLSLWHIRHCRSFLGIELSESSPLIEAESSVDPYFFLPALIAN
ncbi:MAG: hypothetical protein ABIO55_16020 [Ginsengibacter sp.]